MQHVGKKWIALAALVIATGAGIWIATRRDTSPYTLPPRIEPKWTLLTSDGTDPWIVGVAPPESLITALVSQVTGRAGRTLVSPAHMAIPLVLRSEFDESLQGAFGVDSVSRLAADLGLDASRAFEPVCLAHRTVQGAAGEADLYFVPFTSPAFDQLRVSLMPEHPEQAGIGMYDPGLLTPVLIVGATENSFDRWWPLRVDPERDCEAPVTNR